MLRKALWSLAFAVGSFGLHGCGSAPPVPAPLREAWPDQLFAYSPELITVRKEDLFRLDPELAERLADPAIQRLSNASRLERLIAMLYGQEVRRFNYAAGHTTVASETWRLRRGDCLSLTVLAYAMGRALKLRVDMQEVPIAALYERRDQYDFLSQHVNVRFHNTSPVELPHGTSTMPSRDMILDFEPGLGGRHVGEVLSDESILARYYNNIAAEHLAKGRQGLAYAHFKAAILTDPAYAASYGNLAVLYRAKGLQSAAEQLLRHAVALSGQSYVPLYALHQLLTEQGRGAEASDIERQLAAKREVDPYHWIGLGLRHFETGDFRAAIRALKRAQELTTGYEEVHRLLALAYWRAGEQARAHEQLAMLDSISHDGADLSRLRKKLAAPR